MSGEENLARLNNYIAKMPSLPTTVSKVLEICNNPRTSPADLNQVISLDPVLMGKVLKLINSAYYGLSTQITSLVRAIIMLGLNTVKNLALSTAVLDTLSKSKEFRAINMDGFWHHSLCVGVTSRIIARERGVDQKLIEEYFAAGLLHDIGKIPLNNVLSNEYLMTMSLSDRERVSLFDSERRVLGTDHCAVGTLIAQNWKLGLSISDAIAYHHEYLEYQGPNKDIVFTIVYANYFANREEIGFSGNRYPTKVSPVVLEYLGLSPAFADKIDVQVNAEIEKAKVFLKIGG